MRKLYIKNIPRTLHYEMRAYVNPPARRMASRASLLVSSLISDDPAALGCCAMISPDLFDKRGEQSTVMESEMHVTLRVVPTSLWHNCFHSVITHLPIPCDKPKWRRLTIEENTRPSRSPTPLLPWKLFLQTLVVREVCSFEILQRVNAMHATATCELRLTSQRTLTLSRTS